MAPSLLDPGGRGGLYLMGCFGSLIGGGGCCELGMGLAGWRATALGGVCCPVLLALSMGCVVAGLRR